MTSGQRAARRPSPARRRSHRSPSRLAIAAGREQLRVEPSGRPQTARSCCSNWLVTQASKRQVAGVVRARGELVDQQLAGSASGRTRRRARRRRRAASRTPRAISTASRATSGGTAAGATVRSRMWLRWAFSTTPQWAKLPSDAAGGDDRDFALEVDERLEMPLRAGRSARHASSASSAAAMRDLLALAVVAERRRS